MDEVTESHERGGLELCTLADILRRARVSKSAVYAWIAQDKFPKPYLILGPRYTRWLVQEVDLWLADAVAWQASHKPKGGTA